MAGDDDSGDASRKHQEKQRNSKEQRSGASRARNGNEETSADCGDSQGRHPVQKTDKKSSFRVDVESTCDVTAGSAALKEFGKRLGSFMGKAKAVVASLASAEMDNCRKRKSGCKSLRITIKMDITMEDDSDENSSDSDEDNDEHSQVVGDNHEQPSPLKEGGSKEAKEVANEELEIEECAHGRQHSIDQEQEQAATPLTEERKEEKRVQRAALRQLEEAAVTGASSSITETAFVQVPAKGPNAANNGLVANKELSVGEIETALPTRCGSDDVADDLHSEVTATQEVVSCNFVRDVIGERTRSDGVNGPGGEANDSHFTSDGASSVADTMCQVEEQQMEKAATKQRWHEQASNAADCTEQCGKEAKKRKQGDVAAAEPIIDDSMEPKSALEVVINSNKRQRIGDGGNDHEVQLPLMSESTAASCSQYDTNRAKRKSGQRNTLKKAMKNMKNAIIVEEFHPFKGPAVRKAFSERVNELGVSLQINPSPLNLKFISVFGTNNITRCELDVAKWIPVTNFSILCRDFDTSKLPPPPARTVYALMALALSLMENELLCQGKEDNELTALAYVLLAVNNLGLMCHNKIMTELSKYYALLFGEETRQNVSGNKSKRQQEHQDEGQPPILDGLFDYHSGSPVTVHEWGRNSHCSNYKQAPLVLRVAHRIQDEKSKHYYVYLVRSKVESAYAVLYTLLNPLFLSSRWTDVLLDGVPQHLKCKVKELYNNAILYACTCQQYLNFTFWCVKPAIAKSAVKLITVCQQATVVDEPAVVRKKKKGYTSGEVLFKTKEQEQEQEHHRLAEERILAYNAIRSRLPKEHPLHEVMANAYSEEQMAATCDRNDGLISLLKKSLDEQNYSSSSYLGIAEGRLKVRQWITSRVPSIKGSDSDVYEKVHPSEKGWGLYHSLGMDEKNSKVCDEALDYAIFTPNGADTMTGVNLDLVQRRTAQFVYYVLAKYMNPPDEGYDIDDGSAAAVLTTPNKGAAKGSLTHTKNIAFVFWCSDEKLIMEWYHTLYIVLRLHLVQHYKIASTNKVVMHSVQHVGANDLVVIKAKPGTLYIQMVVSKEAPAVVEGNWKRRDSLNVIKLSNLPYVGSNPERKTTALVCPRSVMNCIRNLPSLGLMSTSLVLPTYVKSKELHLKKIVHVYQYPANAKHVQEPVSAAGKPNCCLKDSTGRDPNGESTTSVAGCDERTVSDTSCAAEPAGSTGVHVNLGSCTITTQTFENPSIGTQASPAPIQDSAVQACGVAT